MHFEIIGDIENVEALAAGGRIRDIMRIQKQYGPGRWRNLKCVAKVREKEHLKTFAGSQLQIQIYVNRRTDELSQNILDALPSIASLNPELRLVSPIEGKKLVEYQDRAFLKADPDTKSGLMSK